MWRCNYHNSAVIAGELPIIITGSTEQKDGVTTGPPAPYAGCDS